MKIWEHAYTEAWHPDPDHEYDPAFGEYQVPIIPNVEPPDLDPTWELVGALGDGEDAYLLWKREKATATVIDQQEEP